VLNTGVYDEINRVKNEDAYATGRDFPKQGPAGGHFSGRAVWPAAQLARRPENAGKVIVALLPDTASGICRRLYFRE
jgi:cysteine synthase A